MKRISKSLLFGLAATGMAVSSLYWPLPSSRLDPGSSVSLQITDRNGFLLREARSLSGGRCRWLAAAEVSPAMVLATLAAEDKNFYFHRGIDVPAVGRAILQNLRRRRVFSGASTITQQVVRNIYRHPRTLPGKLLEAWLSLRLENTLSKEDILLQYLNRIPYGCQTYGIEAAARFYFGKPASQLTLAESALLAAVPRSPSAANPYRNRAMLLGRQKEVLRRLARSGWLPEEPVRRAAVEELVFSVPESSFRAPHFCDFVLAVLGPGGPPGASWVRTSLDVRIQGKVEALLRSHLRSLARKNITSGAVIVLDNASGEILAWAGSGDYFDDRNDGQVNGVTALRQPGSSLKPFTYALALESGFTAASILEDSPASFPAADGAYWPENYDRKYHGSLRMRSALACSYNVPAVAVLDRIGPEPLLRRLREAGFLSLTRPPGFYGLGLTLGNGEVSLLELANAYATLARGGVFRAARPVLDVRDPAGLPVSPGAALSSRRVFSAQASYIITDILADADARAPAFGALSPLNLPFPCAAKTGTTKDFRDNWTLGYTVRFTAGVWVGNFDGAAMHNVSGITGSAPLFHDVMLLLHKDSFPGEFLRPAGLVRKSICPASGGVVSPGCPGETEEVFLAGTEPVRACSLHLESPGRFASAAPVEEGGRSRSPSVRISFPTDGDLFRLDPRLQRDYQSVRLRAKVEGTEATAPVEWWVDGRKVGSAPASGGLLWKLRAGSFTMKAVIRTDGGDIHESRPVRIKVIL